MDGISPFFLLGVIFGVPPWGLFSEVGYGIQLAGLTILIIVLIMVIFV